jgi:transcriptional regulator
MYLPKAFEEDRLPILHEAIRSCGLATLVTVTASGPVASHIPMLLDAGSGERGTLLGHVARANGQWRDTLAGTKALAIFHGPDAYVSPSWYPSKRETGKVVPTWNYIAVHAYGAPEFFDDAARLRDLVAKLTERQEKGQPVPWSIADAPADYIAGQLRAIVGVALPIERLEGKWKLSQNRPEADRAGVIAGLGQATDDRTLALRDEMKAREPAERS